jgi:hypothetical protein
MTLAADLAYARVESGVETRTHTSASENFRYHNYGNIKASASPLRWKQYDSAASGVAAVADWLRRSQRDHGTYTLAQMIERYSPAYDNPGKDLIGDAVRRTGFKPNARLDMENFEQLQKTVAAILAQEGAGPVVVRAVNAVPDETPPSRNGPAADKPAQANWNVFPNEREDAPPAGGGHTASNAQSSTPNPSEENDAEVLK